MVGGSVYRFIQLSTWLSRVEMCDLISLPTLGWTSARSASFRSVSGHKERHLHEEHHLLGARTIADARRCEAGLAVNKLCLPFRRIFMFGLCGSEQDPATLKAAREAAAKKIKDNQDAKVGSVVCGFRSA